MNYGVELFKRLSLFLGFTVLISVLRHVVKDSMAAGAVRETLLALLLVLGFASMGLLLRSLVRLDSAYRSSRPERQRLADETGPRPDN